MRDNFSQATKDLLANRVGWCCSNPECGMPTRGPGIEKNDIINIGVAAHIAAASEGGPRYDESMSVEKRTSYENGIWLCQSCSKLIDCDVNRFTVDVLKGWKARAEQRAAFALEGINLKNSTKDYINSIKNDFNIEIRHITAKYLNLLQDKEVDTKRAQERFYKVSSDFEVLVKAVINKWDVAYVEAIDYIIKKITMVEGGILITGNGGMGKTTCMLHVAVQMAMQNKIVIWIDLANSQQCINKNPSYIKDELIELQAVFASEIYLFIENPFTNSQLVQEILGLENNLIKIIISERIQRFDQLLSEDMKANIQYWLEKSYIVCIGNIREETYNWMETSNVEKIDIVNLYVNKIISNFKLFFIQRQFNEEILEYAIQYGKNNFNDDVSLVERIYIILNQYIHTAKKKLIVKNEIKLDWDEWENLISKYTGRNEKYSFSFLAVMYLFKISLDISSIAKIYQRSESQINNWVMNVFHDGIIEPLNYKAGKFTLKHDMIAELYFHFNKNMDPLQVLENTIPYLSRPTLENFCLIVFKKNIILKNNSFCDFFVAKDIIIKFENNQNILKTLEQNDCLIYFEYAKYILLQKEKSTIGNINALRNLIKKYKGKKGENLLFFEQALFYEKERDYLNAKKIYESIYKHNEDNFECALRLGQLCMKMNFMKQAEKIFEHLIQNNDNNIPYIIELGKILILTARVNDAKRLYYDAINRHNYNVQLVQDLGKLLIENSEEEEAERVYNLAIKMKQDNILIYMELGRLYYRQERVEAAEEIYLKALYINPKQTQILIDLAHLYIIQKREYLALNVLKKLINEKDDILEPIIELAKLYIMLSSLQEATQLYYKADKIGKKDKFIIELFHFCFSENRLIELEKIYDLLLEIDNQNYIIFLEYGRICEKRNELDKAQALFLNANEIGFYFDVAVGLLNVYVKKDQWDKIEELYRNISGDAQLRFLNIYTKKLISKNKIGKAINISQEFIDSNGHNYEILSNLANFYLLYEDYENAEKILILIKQEYSLTSDLIIELGNIYINQRKYKNTEELYLDYIENVDNDRKIVLKLAHLYIITNRQQEAEKVYIKELEDCDDDIQILVYLGRLYLNQKNYDKAEKIYKKASQIDEDYIPVLNGLIEISIAYNHKDDLNELIRRRNEISRRLSYKASKQLILKYLETNDFLKAINIYNNLLSRFPCNIAIYIELAKLNEKIGQKKEAIKLYRKALQIKKNNLELLINLVPLYNEVGNDIELEKTLLKILEIDNQNVISSIELSKFYIKKGRFQEAETVLYNVFNPNNIQILTVLGIIFFKQQDFSKAEEKFFDALKINENDIFVLTELGKIYIKEERYYDAEKMFKKVLDISKRDLVSIIELGRLYIKVGRNADAITMFEKALEIDEKSVQVLFVYSTFLYSINEFERAGILLERLLKENPGDIQALCVLQDVYFQLGNDIKRSMVENQLLEVRTVKRIQELRSVFNKLIKLKKYDNAQQLLKCNEYKWKDNNIYKKCVQKINYLLSI